MSPTDNLMDLDQQEHPTASNGGILNNILTPSYQIPLAVHNNAPDSTNNLLSKLLSEMQDIKKDNKVAHAKLDKLSDQHDKATKQFVERISATEKSVQKLEERNAELEKMLDFLEHENESLYRSTNFQNLILLGLPEEESETDDELGRKVSALVNRLTATYIDLDVVYRNKRSSFEEGKCRPVRIRFKCHSDRNKAYDAKKSLPENHYLNEDLPFKMRRDLHALRKKRAELFELKIQHQIDYNRRFIKTSNGVLYHVKDGIIYENNDQEEILGGFSEDETNDHSNDDQRPFKKHKAGPSPNFLGKDSLRPRPPPTGIQSKGKGAAGGRGASGGRGTLVGRGGRVNRGK